MSVTSEALVTPVTKAHTLTQVETVYYQIVHWVPGRFRLRIPRLAYDLEYAIKLKHLIEIEFIDFISSIRINPSARSVIVEYNCELSAAQINTLEERVFTILQAAVNVDISQLPASVDQKQSKSEITEINYLERLGLPVLSLGLALGAMAKFSFPQFWIAAAIFTSAIPVFKRVIDALQHDHELTIDFLDGLAITLQTLQGSYIAPSFMLCLLESGEIVRDLTASGTTRASLDLLDSLGQYALVERDGLEVQIPVKELQPGDLVVVYPGDQIPVDGIIVRGSSLIDQCKLTGESIPVSRSEGQEVFTSTIVVDGQLCIKAEKVGNNTRAGVIVSLIQSAPVHDTRIENYAALIANQAVLPTLFIGGTVFAFTGNLHRATALITLDLGTGIRISVPTTILSAMTYAARTGVYIRSGRAIEILARIDTVVFDKTGTLTQGQARIVDIKTTDADVSELEVLRLAASAEQGLTHPVAKAIVRHAKDLDVITLECETWDYQVGLGVVTTINGQNIKVGSSKLMKLEGIDLDAFNQQYPDIKSGSHSLVYVARDQLLIGVIMYTDPLRSESASVIAELQELGITCYMLSGDRQRVATSVAHELGIQPHHVYAEAFPERKVEVVKELHESGKTVAFCGDGINDSAALAYADVSISFAEATDIARETANVVLMDNDLQSLIHAIRIARQAMDIIWQNTAIVAVPNVAALISGILFTLDPILAVLINNGTAIIAELNGLRPLLGTGVPTPIPLSKKEPSLAITAQSSYLKPALNEEIK
ncbi:MAG TPA: heavy metal translocating P-type ATPase [Leptolyngbyaceae cyanobacterium]